MSGDWREAAAAAAAEMPRPAALVWANPSNLARVNEVLGRDAGDRVLERLTAAVRELGWQARAGDAELVALLPVEVGAAIDLLRPVSWLACLRVGITEVWRFSGGPPVPTRFLELDSAPRFGIAPLGGDLEAAATAAREDCRRQQADERRASRYGFAPVGLAGLRTLAEIGPATCPEHRSAECECPRERALITP